MTLTLDKMKLESVESPRGRVLQASLEIRSGLGGGIRESSRSGNQGQQ